MRVHHIALRTRDLARLERFYVGVLGLLPTRRQDDRSVWLDAGGTILMLERAETGEPATPAGSYELVAFGLTRDEHASATERLAAAGVAVEARTASTLYFRDPDGRRVGLSAWPDELP
jgi:catechol 2,3-dioxygenase-like lactoylglutathione lyase family enzyme